MYQRTGMERGTAYSSACHEVGGTGAWQLRTFVCRSQLEVILAVMCAGVVWNAIVKQF